MCMNEDSLSKLNGVDWDDAAPRLLAFARRWAASLYGWHGEATLPNGMGVEDVVKEAVAAFARGERKLNDRFDTVVQLKGAIRSILWNIHKLKAAELTSSEVPAFFETQLDSTLDPSASAASEDFCRMFIQLLFLDGRVQKSPELLAIVKAYENGGESVEELVEITSLSASRIYELRRQLRDIASTILQKLNRKETAL